MIEVMDGEERMVMPLPAGIRDRVSEQDISDISQSLSVKMTLSVPGDADNAWAEGMELCLLTVVGTSKLVLDAIAAVREKAVQRDEGFDKREIYVAKVLGILNETSVYRYNSLVQGIR